MRNIKTLEMIKDICFKHLVLLHPECVSIITQMKPGDSLANMDDTIDLVSYLQSENFMKEIYVLLIHSLRETGKSKQFNIVNVSKNNINCLIRAKENTYKEISSTKQVCKLIVITNLKKHNLSCISVEFRDDENSCYSLTVGVQSINCFSIDLISIANNEIKHIYEKECLRILHLPENKWRVECL